MEYELGNYQLVQVSTRRWRVNRKGTMKFVTDPLPLAEAHAKMVILAAEKMTTAELQSTARVVTPGPTTRDARILQAIDALKRIQALAENPHWTADRRWRIGELAGQGLTLLNPLVFVKDRK
jgi:hydroxymethylpyrimidine/phosphomethylpyrimidine kinase